VYDRHVTASLFTRFRRMRTASTVLAYVRDQLGHASIRMTVDIYGHLTPGGHRAAVNRLDDVEAAVH
jgi:integrase